MRASARRIVPVLGLFVLGAVSAARGAAGALDAPARQAIDDAAKAVLAATGAPSASVAVVSGGAVAYVQAYGSARLAPALAPAAPGMRYSIGSVSKQFTSTAILMLAEEGKLSLDDAVSKFVPGLTRGDEITIRQILSHTSGYQDYWPQDYVPPFMLQPTTAAEILDRWAKKPLDFEPGTQYQYSNTGYVLAGVIVEKASGTPLLPFLTARIFKPLSMASVANIDQDRLGDTDPTGYLRYALGPPRPAPKEGKGWLFAAGELAMTAGDLARWNLGMIQQKLLKPASYREMQRDVLLKNGLGIGYGLGIDVRRRDGHRLLEHGGEVSGFTAANLVFPDDGVAVTVLVNQDSIDTSGALAGKIADILLAGRAPAAEARARRIFEGLQAGKLDRSALTPNANSYFTAEAIADFASSLAPLGAPKEVKQKSSNDRGGMTFRLFDVVFPGRTLAIWERDMPDGQIEQFQVMATE
ncbi:MAG TPA: serine hydrolase domain-containing protein [Thermoanaerobaculia bacterium]|nr:serine hydrolase domain-containing protein [Thermoanaerobaculia bacterium]